MSTPETKDRLLDTAERLFAKHGFEATSVRMITTAAAANQAAINYHFGSKEGLIKAVIARRAVPVNEERLRLLAQYEQEAGDKPPPLEKILYAFTAPMLRLCLGDDGGHHILRLMGIVHSLDIETSHDIMFELFGDVARRFYQVLVKHNPNLTQEELHSRFGFMFGAVMGTMKFISLRDYLTTRGAPDVDHEKVTAFLINFLVGGFTRPPSEFSERSSE